MNKLGQPLSPRKPPRRAPICLRHMEYKIYDSECWSCRGERLSLRSYTGYCVKHKRSLFGNYCRLCYIGKPKNTKKACLKHDVIYMGKCYYCVLTYD